MNLLSIAEQIASLDLSPIHVEAEHCLHAVDPRSTCDQCIKTCPTQALSFNKSEKSDKSVTLKIEACVLCGLCLHDCPVGALNGPDKVAEEWTLASRPEEPRTLELACSRHSSPEIGPARTDAVLRLSTCLAALSPSAYIGLLSLGLDRVAIRVDECSACPVGTAKAAIERTVATTRQLLTARQEADRVTVIDTDHGRGWTRRPVYTKNSDLSRRDLFRRFSPKHQAPAESAGQVFDAPLRDEQPSNVNVGKQPSRERRRLVNALRRLAPVRTLASYPLEIDSLARITADDTCSACGACARICPTGALNLVTPGDNRYQLTFTAGECINCGLCMKVCAPEALHREAPTLADLVKSGPTILQSGTLRKCVKCSARFASATESDLCPICAFRSQHPLGSQLPPGLLKQLASAAKQPVGRPK